MTGSFALEV